VGERGLVYPLRDCISGGCVWRGSGVFKIHGLERTDEPTTDAAGLANTNFPEASSTSYFGTLLTAPIGTVFTIHGEYPLCRFMALEIYTSDQLVGFINDFQINPDPGTNNPFVSARPRAHLRRTLFSDRNRRRPPRTPSIPEL